MPSLPVGEIICGDCLDVMRTWPDGCVDLIIADPPYSINSKSDGQGKLSPWADMVNNAYWHAAWVKEARRILKHDGALWAFLNWRSLVSYQKAACDLGWPIESLLVWDKEWIGPGGCNGLRPSYELVALWRMPEFGIGDRGVYDIQRFKWSSIKPSGHPAEKPEALATFLINISKPDPCIVLDPFAGSGAFCAAAQRLGYAAIGIEIDSCWVNYAQQRLNQKSLFTEELT